MSVLSDTIRAARLAKGWSVDQAAGALHRAMPQPPQRDSLIRRWKSWESGTGGVSDTYRHHLAHLLGLDAETLGLPSSPDRMRADRMADWLHEFERSDIGPGTLDALDRSVDRLCRNYPLLPTVTLLDDLSVTLNQTLQLRDRRPTLDQHRDLLVAAGWLNTLLACVLWDDGSRHASEAARDTARHLASQSRHDEIAGWTWEMAAWHFLTARRYNDVVVYAESGEHIAPGTHAAVHCAVHTARGWARLGDLKQTEAALERADRTLDHLPPPDLPGHHFVFDPSKLMVARACCYTWVGQWDRAAAAAQEVLRDATLPDGSLRWPMRCAEMHCLLAVGAAHQGDLSHALDLGALALSAERVSGPALVDYGRDLATVMQTRWPKEPAAVAFIQQYRTLSERYRAS